MSKELDEGRAELQDGHLNLGVTEGGPNNDTKPRGPNRGRPPKAYTWTRDRANSESSITKYLLQKRKRDLNSSSSPDSEDYRTPLSIRTLDRLSGNRNTRNKKHKTFLSSPSNNNAMEEKLDLILARLNGVEASLSTEISDLRNEIGDRIRKLEEECDHLRKTNEELLRREKRRDDRIEKHERLLRRCNAVVSGLTVNPHNRLEEVNNFFKERFSLPDSVEEVRPVGNRDRQKMLVKFSSLKSKDTVMKQKKDKLRKENIYIENDNTEYERHIAYKGRCQAREIVRNGGTAIATHNKLVVDGQVRVWNSEQEAFLPLKRRNRTDKQHQIAIKDQRKHNSNNELMEYTTGDNAVNVPKEVTQPQAKNGQQTLTAKKKD